MAAPNCRDGHLQGARRGAGDAAHAQSRRGPAGGPVGPWRHAQGGLRLSKRALRILGGELSWGAFGENFTTAGLLEDRVHIGDRYRIGEAEVVVTQPRMPCFKLGIKFGDPRIVQRFLESGRSGFYLAVLREGIVEAGDPIELLGEDPNRVTVADINRLFLGERDDALARALKVEALPEGWKVHLLRQAQE